MKRGRRARFDACTRSPDHAVAPSRILPLRRGSLRGRQPHAASLQLCYCTICRKTAGGGGYAINLGADSRTLAIEDRSAIGIYRAEIADEHGACTTSEGERNFCTRCATALWLYDPRWPTLLHPFASAIDTPLPVPPSRTHILLGSKAAWVVPRIEPDDLVFDAYFDQSIDEWHESRGLWVD